MPFSFKQDKDPEALTDTRRSQPPVVAKTDLEVIIEKHKTDLSAYDIGPVTVPPPMPAFAHVPPSFAFPPPFAPPPMSFPPWPPYDPPYGQPQQGLVESNMAGSAKDNDEELAMLGIDPNDLAGFGN